MRVCVLTQASPCTWAAHYIAAFRRCCDTLVIGPTPDAEALRAWGRTGAEHLIPANDIECDFASFDGDLLALLPPDWIPDLVVGISGVGGDPLYAHIARLTCPTAFLSIDTWQCLLDFREAIKYDFVFAAQREFVPHLRATGSRHVSWLPLACAPEAHYPAGGPPEYDIAFAGSASQPIHRERRALLELLAQRFSVLAQESVFGDDLCAMFGRGRLAFNHSAVQELNMRIFEALAMGRPLLTNADSAFNGLLDLFEDGRHLITYTSAEDLIEKTQRYLADETARNKVGEAGRAEVLAKHTYDHRVRTLLEHVQGHMAHAAERRLPAASEEPRLHDFLPTIPGRTVDIGLILGVSKVALRRRGVTHLTGVPEDLVGAQWRQGSYDALDPLLALPDAQADTVVAAAPNALKIPLEDLVWEAHRLLQPGGTMVLRLDDRPLSEYHLKPGAASVGPWMEQRDFHLRMFWAPQSGGGGILQARKRTRALKSVVAEVFERLQAPGINLPELLTRIPPGW